MNTFLKSVLGVVLFAFALKASAAPYFIKLKPSYEPAAIATMIQAKCVQSYPAYKVEYQKAFARLNEQGLDRVYVFELPDQASALLLRQISEMQGIDYLEAVPVFRLHYTPNDYNATTLWHLAKISAPAAWDIEKGGKGIVLGLIDDGMDTLHSDLQPALWHNAKEIKGNGFDDDNNGYTDDFFGWDAADSDNDPSVVSSNGLSHGTHCGGIAGARTDNNNGIASVGFNIRIMPVKVGRTGQQVLFNVYQAVEYAIVNKANVISMSLGGGGYSNTFQTLFDVAYQRNIVCVASAGNSFDSARNYPAAYRHVIAVGSTDRNDVKSGFSCWGTWVDVMAPGSSVYSSLPGNAYGTKSGTSMACPMVSGLCALMLSRNPLLTVSQLESCLKSSCDNINAQNTSYVGYMGAGRINANRALQCLKSVNAAFTSAATFVCTGDTVRFFDKSKPASTSRTWNFQGGSPAVSTAQNPLVRYNTAGTYKVQLIAVRGSVADTIEKTAYITVGKPSVQFSGNQTVNKGEFATIRADFTGVPPWTLIYRAGNRYDTIKDIVNSPYYILKLPDSSRVYKPVSVKGGTCAGTVKDSSIITVNYNVSSLCDSAYRFHLSFGGNADDLALDVAVGKDSFIYLAGQTNSNGAGAYDGCVSKIGPSGKIYWYKTLGGSSDDGFLTMAIDQNDNLYCGGYSLSNVNYRAAAMVKYDRNGNLKWRKYYNGNEREYIYDAQLSKDQRYVYFTGHSISDTYGGEDYTVYKLDTSGAVQWVKRFGNTDTERPYGIMEDDSGNIYALGNQVGSNTRGIIVKMNNAGSQRYSKIYSGSNSGDNILFTDAAVWSKQHMYAVGSVVQGSGNRRTIVTKLNYNGTVVWAREISYGNLGSQNKIRVVNGRLVIGTYATVSSRVYGLFITLDSNANVLSAKQVGNTGMNTYLMRFDVNSDNSLTYAGYQNSGSNNQYMLGKTNCSINNACLFSNTSVSSAAYTLTASNYTVSSKDFTSVLTPNHTQNSYTLNSAFNCKTVPVQMKKNCRLNAAFSNSKACTGDSVGFSDASIDSNGFVISNRHWSFGDGSQISGPASVKHRYTANGTYTVRLIVNSSNGSLTCSDTISRLYNSADSLNVAYMPADSTICVGDSIVLMAPVMACGKPPYTYAWSPAKGLSDSTLARPFFAPRVSTTYTVKVKDFNGMTASGSFKVLVNTACCKSKARFRTSAPVICEGDSVRFINASTYDAGSAYFKWVFTNASLASYIGINPPAIVFTPGTAGTATLQLSDICANDTVKVNIVRRPLPVAFAGRDSIFCRRDTLLIGSEQLGRNTYLWQPSAGLDDNKRPDPTAIVSGSTQYILKLTDENGCVGLDTINLQLNPEILIIRSDTAICAGDSLKLTIPGTGLYKWSNGAVTQSIHVKAPGLFWGERTSNCTARDTVNLLSKAGPVFSLGKDTFFCKGNPITLVSPLAGQYNWSTGYTGNAIQVSNAGFYWLMLSNNGCSSSDTIQVSERPLPVFTLGPDRKLCRDSLSLSAQPNQSNLTYNWNTGATGPQIKVRNYGQYILKAVNADACAYSDSILITQGLLPVLPDIGNLYKCINTPYVLELPLLSGQTYRWNDQSTNYRKVFMSPGQYQVTAQTECGDSSLTFEVIDSNCSCEVWIPNAFSPNGDAKNDRFGIVSQCNLIDYTLRIFNRWGEIIFESNDPQAVWDGTYKGETVPQGVYFYALEFRKDMPTVKEYNFKSGPIILTQ